MPIREINRAIGLCLSAIRTSKGDRRDWLCLALRNLRRARQYREPVFLVMAQAETRLALACRR